MIRSKWLAGKCRSSSSRGAMMCSRAPWRPGRGVIGLDGPEIFMRKETPLIVGRVRAAAHEQHGLDRGVLRIVWKYGLFEDDAVSGIEGCGQAQPLAQNPGSEAVFREKRHEHFPLFARRLPDRILIDARLDPAPRSLDPRHI